MTATLSSHVLNLETGRPAAGLSVSLSTADGTMLATAQTNDDGRISDWPGVNGLGPGIYQLRFDTGDWYAAASERCFYPEVTIRFQLEGDLTHYHVPLLLNRFGYSTYRGS